MRFKPTFFLKLLYLNSLFWGVSGNFNFANGQNWEQVPISTTGTLQEVEHLPDIGWIAAGDSGLVFYKSDNDWSKIVLSENSSVFSVEFLNFTSTSGKTFLINENKNAFYIQPNPFEILPDTLPKCSHIPLNINRLVNLNITNSSEYRFGMPADSGRLIAYKTTWPQPRFDFDFITPNAVNDLYPFNAWNVLAVGDSGKIWRTIGLDNAFVQVNHNLTFKKLNRIFGKGNGLIWVGGEEGTLLFSSNGGVDWSQVSIPSSQNINSGSAADSTVWLCGNNGTIFFSQDLGQTWLLESTGISNDLLSIKAFGNEVFACGKQGTLIHLNRLTQNKAAIKWNNSWISHGEGHILLNLDPGFKGKISLFSTEGKLIQSKSIADHPQQEFMGLKSGLYLVRMEDKSQAPTHFKIWVGN